MAKKEKKGQVEEGAAEAAGVVTEAGVVFVNPEKLHRAQRIQELVAGKKAPKDGAESDLKDRFTGHLADADVEPKGKGALQFIYEKLGGLVRTPGEQQAADDDAKAAKRKSRGRAIEADKDAK